MLHEAKPALLVSLFMVKCPKWGLEMEAFVEDLKIKLLPYTAPYVLSFGFTIGIILQKK